MFNISKDKISKSEIIRYLGYPDGNIDLQTDKLIDLWIDKCLEKITPRFTFIDLIPIFDLENNTVLFDGTNLILNGKSIFDHLMGSTNIVCFAATLGADIEKEIRFLSYSEITSSVIADAVCSEIVEVVCDMVEIEIKNNPRLANLESTSRFSPGYGDLPIDIQSDIINLLDASKKIGLTCTQNNLLIPRKSVTAFIGFSENFSDRTSTKTCSLCSIKDKCNLKKAGKYCGYKKNN